MRNEPQHRMRGIFTPLFKRFAPAVLGAGLSCACSAADPDIALGGIVELQPLAAQAERIVEALAYFGAPLSPTERQALVAATSKGEASEAVTEIQKVLDPHCLISVHINPEMRVKVAQGKAGPELVERGWRTFLVKVENEAGATSELRAVSPQAQSVHDSPWQRTPSDKFYRERGHSGNHPPAAQLWLDLEMFNKQPLKKELSELRLEYRILSLYAQASGRREAKLSFNVGQGTQDLGFRSEV